MTKRRQFTQSDWRERRKSRIARVPNLKTNAEYTRAQRAAAETVDTYTHQPRKPTPFHVQVELTADQRRYSSRAPHRRQRSAKASARSVAQRLKTHNPPWLLGPLAPLPAVGYSKAPGTTQVRGWDTRPHRTAAQRAARAHAAQQDIQRAMARE